jgi:hypothetical protein
VAYVTQASKLSPVCTLQAALALLLTRCLCPPLQVRSDYLSAKGMLELREAQLSGELQRTQARLDKAVAELALVQDELIKEKDKRGGGDGWMDGWMDGGPGRLAATAATAAAARRHGTFVLCAHVV